jgi:phage-related protein
MFRRSQPSRLTLIRVKDVKLGNLKFSEDEDVLYTARLLDAETSARSVTLSLGRGGLEVAEKASEVSWVFAKSV